jgi:3-methylcrotonyl-CoA carboxylase alpha subunit
MFTKLLIANRGEIACRIIKTARRLGIETVAVYSTADRDGLHVQQADAAYCIGAPAASASYLNVDAIIAAAKDSGAQAIHPGYGFLSENPQLASACAAANIVFIGPGIPALEAMASKQVAKQLLEKTLVPLTPGYHGHDQTDKQLLAEAHRIGFPVLLKAAAGGGGKGMRAVHDAAAFDQALASARREAKASFADDTMLIEKLIQNPRHVEMQIMADNHGNVVHLFERDCSLQRRHQKIIEEAPAPNLSKRLREQLAEAAIAVAKTIDYRGAGTVEFLVTEDAQFYFMEMNTRLQVEHPVTEMITGLDLVEWQLRIAANEPLPKKQSEIHHSGHALECRIYAEDPQHDFIPSIGQIRFLKEPSGDGIRIDTGITCGSTISMYYDPMIAKLIVWGDDRAQALQRLQYALQHYHVGGVKTNLAFLNAVLHHPRFIKAAISTDFLVQERIILPIIEPQRLACMAACVDYLQLTSSADSLAKDTFAWQMHLQAQWRVRYLIEDKRYDIMIMPINPHAMQLTIDGESITVQASLRDDQLHWDDGTAQESIWFETTPEHSIFYTNEGPATVNRFRWQSAASQEHGKGGQLTAPMPATIVDILKQKGDKIKAGDRLIILEAMKMEHTIHAPNDGILTAIFYEIGAQVNEGAELVTLEMEELS